MLAAWDEYLAGWVRGDVPLPPMLRKWRDSYHGRGLGAVTADAMPEPFIGDWERAKLVTLGLNPGAADRPFQARGGYFAEEIAKRGFSEWAKTDPYGSDLWEDKSTVNGPRKNGRRVNGYRAARVQFARRWLHDGGLGGADLLMLELYPWHSARVTAAIKPPPGVLSEFIWEPLGEVDEQEVFAFGAPWLKVAEDLGLDRERRFERGSFRSASRQAATFALPSGQQLVVVWQSGYAGPPGAEDTQTLRELLSR
jgi:hypothetical protein